MKYRETLTAECGNFASDCFKTVAKASILVLSSPEVDCSCDCCVPVRCTRLCEKESALRARETASLNRCSTISLIYVYVLK